MRNGRYRANLVIIKHAMKGIVKAFKPQSGISTSLVDIKDITSKIEAIHETDASDNAVYAILYSISEPWDYLSTRRDILSEEHRERAERLAEAGQALAYEIAIRDVTGSSHRVMARA